VLLGHAHRVSHRDGVGDVADDRDRAPTARSDLVCEGIEELSPARKERYRLPVRGQTASEAPPDPGRGSGHDGQSRIGAHRAQGLANHLAREHFRISSRARSGRSGGDGGGAAGARAAGRPEDALERAGEGAVERPGVVLGVGMGELPACHAAGDDLAEQRYELRPALHDLARMALGQLAGTFAKRRVSSR
jgi:hypothetical protein